jgi:prevent-host-death family protein
MYSGIVDVAVTELRAQLRTWLDRARAGEEVVITERGIPIARLSGVSTAPLLERLTNEGVIGRPVTTQRPQATARKRVRATRPLSEIISEQRR